jgi:hypothetical protein
MPKKGTSTKAGLVALQDYLLQMRMAWELASESVHVARARMEAAGEALHRYEKATAPVAVKTPLRASKPKQLPSADEIRAAAGGNFP